MKIFLNKIEYKILLFFTLILMLLVGFGNMSFAEDYSKRPVYDLEEIVDRFEVSSNNIKSGEEIELNIGFSIPNEFKVEYGTKVTIPFPSESNNIIYSTDVLEANLYNELEETLGSYRIDTSGITLIFSNEDIENRINISGELFLGVRIRNIGNSSETITFIPGGNASKEESIDIEAEEDNNGGPYNDSELAFVHKSADNYDCNPGEVRWSINLNPGLHYVRDYDEIDFEDSLGENHKLVEDSISIVSYYHEYLDERLPKKVDTYSIDEFHSEGLGNFSIKDDLSGFYISLNSKALDRKNVVIIYKSKLDDQYLEEVLSKGEKPKVSNTINGRYTYQDKNTGEEKRNESSSEESFYEYNVFGYMNGVRPLPREVILIKTDSQDKNLYLSDAKFQLYRSNDELYSEEIYTTCSLGMIKIKNLDVGDYYFREVEAPEGYELSDEKIRFEILEHASEGVKLEFKNNREPKKQESKSKGSFKLLKKDSKTGAVLRGAKFNLYKNGEYLDTFETSVDGIIIAEKIPFGDYILKEVEAPEGYILDEDNEYEISISSKEIVEEIVITNDIEEDPVVPEEDPVVPEEDPVVPEEDPVVPEEDPVVPEEDPVVPEEDPVVPEEDPVVPEEDPVVPKEDPVVPKEDPVVPEEDPVVAKEDPVVPKEDPVVPKEDPVVPKEDPVVPKEDPVVPKEDPVVPKEKKVLVTLVDSLYMEKEVPKEEYLVENIELAKEIEDDLILIEDEYLEKSKLEKIEIEAVSDMKELPKTGEKTPWIFYIIGFSLVVLGFSFKRKVN